jgi:hypothetical protein
MAKKKVPTPNFSKAHGWTKKGKTPKGMNRKRVKGK